MVSRKREGDETCRERGEPGSVKAGTNEGRRGPTEERTCIDQEVRLVRVEVVEKAGERGEEGREGRKGQLRFLLLQAFCRPSAGLKFARELTRKSRDLIS